MKTRRLNCMHEYEESYEVCPFYGYDRNTPMENPACLNPGTVLGGRYLVGCVLGAGGFGITYIGWDSTLQQKVAIKEYYPSFIASRHSSVSLNVTISYGKATAVYEKGKVKLLEEAR
ncbi:MAG: hypothetical protein LUH55_05120 [Bacteroides thetaiotaomicron]|nr:hypothetical protein [Bacteroides thetaiotaomicron]